MGGGPHRKPTSEVGAHEILYFKIVSDFLLDISKFYKIH